MFTQLMSGLDISGTVISGMDSAAPAPSGVLMASGGLGSLIGALVSVVAIMFLAYWFSRMLGRRFGSGMAGKHLKMVDRIQVGADRYVILLELKERYYLVGVSPAGITLLSEPEGPFEEAEMQAGQNGVPGFQDILKTYASLRQKTKGDKHE